MMLRRLQRGWRAVLGVLALGVVVACGDAAPAVVPATVQETRGATFACRDTFPLDLTGCPAATVNSAVVVNGGVHSGPGDTTLLMQTGKTRFRLLPSSSLRYVANSGLGVTFLLTAGRLFADHDAAGGALVIQSGNSAISALGTLFTVATDSSGAVIVSVQGGTVAVEVPRGSQQIRNVTQGQGIQIPAGATAPPLPRAMTPSELRLWQRIGPNLTLTP